MTSLTSPRTDQLRRDLDVRRAVVQLRVRFGRLAAQQRDRGVDGGRGLILHRLVDGRRLPAEEDVLQARDIRVLARDCDTRQVVVLQHLDDASGVGVVRNPHAVDLAAERGQSLLEVGLRLGLVPCSRRLGCRDDAFGFHDLDRAIVEHGRVAVGRVATHVDDDCGCGILARGREAVEHGLTLQAADLDVVERHVVVSARERTVVCDDGNALGLGLGGDRLGSALVVHQQHDAAALGQLLVGDRRVLVDVTLGVLDVDLEAGALQTLLEVLAVEVLPARRRRRVGEDDARTTGCVASSVATLGRRAAARAGTAGQEQRSSTGEGGRGED